MKFHHRPRDADSLSNLEVYYLAAQVDTLQNFVMAIALGYAKVIGQKKTTSNNTVRTNSPSHPLAA